jgi:hypothetical protein
MSKSHDQSVQMTFPPVEEPSFKIPNDETPAISLPPQEEQINYKSRDYGYTIVNIEEPRDALDHDFETINATEIAQYTGRLSVQTTIQAPPSPSRNPSNWRGPTPRSKLSARGKLLADTTEYSDKQNDWRHQ